MQTFDRKADVGKNMIRVEQLNILCHKKVATNKLESMTIIISDIIEFIISQTQHLSIENTDTVS